MASRRTGDTNITAGQDKQRNKRVDEIGLVHGSKYLFGCDLIHGSKGDGAIYKARFFGASQVQPIEA